MKRNKLKSVKTPLYRWLCVSAVVCLFVSSFYLMWTAILNEKHFSQSNLEAITRYRENFDSQLQAMRTFNESLTINNIQFRTLGQSNCTSQQQIVAEHTLAELIKIQTPRYGISLLYNGNSGRALFYYGEDVQEEAQFLQNSSFMHMLGEFVSTTHTYVYNQWFLLEQDDRWILLLVNKYRDLYFCSIVDLEYYFLLNPANANLSEVSVMVYAEDSLLFESQTDVGQSLLPQVNEKEGVFSAYGYHVVNTWLQNAPLGIAMLTPRSALISKQLPNVLFFLMVVVFVAVFLRKVMRFLNQSLLFPLHEIAAQTAALTGDNPPASLGMREDFEEYNAIRVALNGLIEKKNELEMQNCANRAQKEHALLQYYQLQTRSHFFLNCLKSLYSMAEKSNRAQMQAMIIAFSSHLRYIFHDNLNEVTLQDEIKEIMDYHRIITMDFSRPFLLTPNVPKELLDVLVPPLIIQTFLENTYKYAQGGKGILVFQVEASVAEQDGKKYLRLHMWDNGDGYPPDVLASLNEAPASVFADYHVGINNLLHRMTLLYGKNFRTAFYNEKSGNAHSVLYIPIARKS